MQGNLNKITVNNSYAKQAAFVLFSITLLVAVRVSAHFFDSLFCTSKVQIYSNPQPEERAQE